LLPAKLNETMSREMDVELSLVTSHARRLREAGFMSVGGRGNSAAQMTPRDGATLLIAVAGSESPSVGPAAVKAYARAVTAGGAPVGVLGSLGLSERGLDACTAMQILLQAASDGNLDKALRAAGVEPGDAASNAFEAAFMVTAPVRLQIRFAGFKGESAKEQVTYATDIHLPPPRTRTMRLVAGKAIVSCGRALSA